MKRLGVKILESKFDFGAEMTLSIEEDSLFYGAGLPWARDEKCFFSKKKFPVHFYNASCLEVYF